MTSAIEKNLCLLETLANATSPMTIADLSDALGMPKQTVQRLVTELERLGILTRGVPKNRILFGPKFRSLSINSLRAETVLQTTRPILGDLVRVVKETCNIGVLAEREVVYVDRLECDWPLRVQLQPGSGVPVHCTAIGKLLLAYLPKIVRLKRFQSAPLARYTTNTITDPQLLEDHLAGVREKGYAVNNQEDWLGLIALAVPIFDQRGQVQAGLAIHAPTARMTTEGLHAIRPRLEESAQALSKSLFPSPSRANESCPAKQNADGPIRGPV